MPFARRSESLQGQGFAEAELDQIGVMDGEPDDPVYEGAYQDALAGNVAIVTFTDPILEPSMCLRPKDPDILCSAAIRLTASGGAGGRKSDLSASEVRALAECKPGQKCPR